MDTNLMGSKCASVDRGSQSLMQKVPGIITNRQTGKQANRQHGREEEYGGTP